MQEITVEQKLAGRQVTPPTQTARDTRAAEHSEARDLRRNRAVSKLKKVLTENDDITELDSVRAAVDQLPE